MKTMPNPTDISQNLPQNDLTRANIERLLLIEQKTQSYKNLKKGKINIKITRNNGNTLNNLNSLVNSSTISPRNIINSQRTLNESTSTGQIEYFYNKSPIFNEKT